MNNWIVIDYFFGIVDSFLLFYFTDKFLTRKEVNSRQIVLVIFIQAIINYYINNELGVANLLGLVIMIMAIVMLFSSIFREKFINIAFIVIVGVVLISVIEILVVTLIMFVTNTESTMFFSNNIYRITGGTLSKITLYLVIKNLVEKIRFKAVNHFNKIQVYQLIFVLGLNIIAIFLAIWFYKNTYIIKGNEKRYITILSVGIIIFTIAMLSITKKIVEYATREAEWNLREREYKRQNFYIKNMDEMLKNLRAQRHDFNNHINCLYGLISMKEFEKTKKYIERLTEETKEYNEIINVGNPILTSLLNVKMTQAKNKKIKIEASIEISEELSIEYIDLSIIIGNLLDNAIEASENMEVDDKYIEVNIYTKMNNLIIKVINMKQREIELKGKINKEKFTTKQDTENHGFGLKNIRQVVEKYRGIIKIEDEGDIFKINIAIPIISDQ